MAIIKPSRKFAGSDLKTSNASRYIKESVKVLSFGAKENKDGVHLYILPAYKTDSAGEGVWFKTVTIRDNFGDKFKEKYAVSPNFPDPVAHFERNFKIHFPDESKPIDEEVEGQVRKKYPNYGRIARRVLFNVALARDIDSGPHILDLPAFGGASQIMEWQEGKDRKGNERPLINDPENACSVFIKLKEKVPGNPWQVDVDATDRFPLPDELADSEQIYNLDEILDYKTPAELIEKLKGMYTPDVFDLCMQGYNFGTEGPITVPSTKARTPAIVTKPAPTTKAAVAPGLQVDPDEKEDEIPMTFVEDEGPVEAPPTRPRLSKEDAKSFLQSPRRG